MSRYFFSLILIVSVLTIGCAGARRAPEANDGDDTHASESVSIPSQSVETESIPEMGPNEAYGPAAPTETNPETPVQPPPPAQPKLCLVLGPGFARAIAHAGVIEAFVKNQIPIHCIVGVEMGGVVGAFYALSGSVNTMQWQLFKLNKDNLFNFPMIQIGAKRSSGKEFHKFLHEIISDRTIDSLKVSFAAVATQPSGGQSVVFSSGNLSDALSASLALPGVYDPWKMPDGQRLIGGGVSAPLPVEIARKLGGTFIVAVSVVPDPGDPAGRSDEMFEKAFIPVLNLSKMQERGADIVIKPDLRDAAYDDFSQLGTLVSAGREKVNELATEIKSRWERSVQEHQAK
jgi:NTE family protein